MLRCDCESHTAARDSPSLYPKSWLIFLFTQLFLPLPWESYLKRNPYLVPLSKSHLVFLLPSPPLFCCLHKEKKFLDTRPTHGIYTFGVNPASGSTQSWQVDRFIETRIVMIFISAVKNSILKKIYTFSIAFLELTISKKKLLFFF